MNMTLHVVSLNIPWPANYGGVIDIYYKLKALHACGVKIILHCFEYGRPHAAALEEVCEKVYYYRRHTGLRTNITYLPYNVYSRKDPALIARLLENDHPVLFEGLHSCYYLNDRRLKDRFKIFRECNIEHDYYREIALAENHLLRKWFHYIEAIRFKWFQKNVAYADLTIAVSMTDTEYLRRTFPRSRVEFIPCFHGNERITASPGASDFLLYHGNLSVKENEKAALYLIKKVFGQLPFRCIIAGMMPSEALLNAARSCPNIRVEANPSVDRIHELIREAQINVLVTFQDTGLKLKLLNSLFAGRHTVVNSLMLAGSGLDCLCHVGDTPGQLLAHCKNLMNVPFDAGSIEERIRLLLPAFSDEHQARRLIRLIRT
ncbi:MAG: glycosyltransferase [Tannerella sp.]|jgi:glycosyltransferase involved in cell wall biosynthesis|nr:glycosyltransferase [Tannerella sp.]